MKTDSRRKQAGTGSGTGLAVISLAAVLAGMAAVQLLLETPRSRERLTDLWSTSAEAGAPSPIRTVSAEVLDAVEPSNSPAAETAIVVQSDAGDRDVTGSIPPTDPQRATMMTTSRSSFGADIGGSGNIRDIRALWASIQPGLHDQARTVQPLLVFQDGAPMQQLRLVLGPVANAGDVATLCAMMPPSIETCTVAPFNGQPLPTN